MFCCAKAVPLRIVNADAVAANALLCIANPPSVPWAVADRLGRPVLLMLFAQLGTMLFSRRIGKAAPLRVCDEKSATSLGSIFGPEDTRFDALRADNRNWEAILD